jgi:TPR repeat protein
MVCIGCLHANAKQNDHDICPFCISPVLDMLENVADLLQELHKQLEVNDPKAFFNMGAVYSNGDYVVQDKPKAFEYYIRGAELESGKALNAVANADNYGYGVEKMQRRLNNTTNWQQ